LGQVLHGLVRPAVLLDKQDLHDKLTPETATIPQQAKATPLP